MPVSIKSGAKIASVIRLRVLFSIGEIVEAGAFVRLVHKFYGVANSQLHSRETGPGADVHLATGIAGGQYSSVCFLHVGQLLVQDALRHVGLEQVVNTGSAAASFGSVERDKIFRCNSS